MEKPERDEASASDNNDKGEAINNTNEEEQHESTPSEEGVDATAEKTDDGQKQSIIESDVGAGACARKNEDSYDTKIDDLKENNQIPALDMSVVEKPSSGRTNSQALPTAAATAQQQQILSQPQLSILFATYPTAPTNYAPSPAGEAHSTGQHSLNSPQYTDASFLSDPTPDTRRNRGGVTKPFPLKLHEMLDAMEQEGQADVVGFFSHGRAFAIHKPRKFIQDIMPRFFNQSRLTSFQRQLNLYGFRRISQGPDNGGYYHELFLKGRPGLCVNMKRTKIKGTTKKKRDPASEPNFYAYPPIESQPMPTSPPAASPVAPNARSPPKSISSGSIPAVSAPLASQPFLAASYIPFASSQAMMMARPPGPYTAAQRTTTSTLYPIPAATVPYYNLFNNAVHQQSLGLVGAPGIGTSLLSMPSLAAAGGQGNEKKADNSGYGIMNGSSLSLSNGEKIEACAEV